MPEMVILNPSPRPSEMKKTKTTANRGKSKMAAKKKWGSPAQRAALKKAQAARRKSTSTKRKNPISQKTSTKRRSTTKKGMFGGVIKIAKPAVYGIGGALVLDAVMGQVKPRLPVEMQTGPMYGFIKGTSALLTGIVLDRFVKTQVAYDMAKGALIVAGYSEVKPMVEEMAPQIQLGNLEDDYGSMGRIYQNQTPSLGKIYTGGRMPSAMDSSPARVYNANSQHLDA